ncbi:MAG: type II toxin-antitoxin system VapC family toxin [Candidatus Binatia bacterium]
MFVDSGVWIAFFSIRDGRHADADALIRAAAAHRLVMMTTNLVLAEVHRWLLFHAGIQPAGAALAAVDATSLLCIEWTTAEHHSAARDWLARLPDQRITYTDAVSFAVMAAQGCRAVMSFDRDFAVAGFTPWWPPR